MQRDAHLELIDRLTGLMAIMSRDVVTAIRHASTALLEADADAAQAAFNDYAAICRVHRQIDNAIPVVLARQQPVASDLRLVLAALRINSDLKRMGALARHIAEIAAGYLPDGVGPASAIPTLTSMAASAATMAERSAVVLATRDPVDAMQLGLDDDVTDALVRDLFLLITSDGWTHGTRAAIDLARLGRFYERFADHAVSIADQVVYVVTGEYRTVPS